VALALVPSSAWAYPTSVVFSPTGETKPLGTAGLLAYTSTTLSPSVSAGSSWFGVEAGVLPQWAYGSSGVSFGGLEVGFDAITPYGRGIVKPVLNAKLGLVTEGRYWPSLAVGVMEVSPALPAMDFVFVSATKALGPVGPLTLGFGDNAGDPSVFAGSFPFTSGGSPSHHGRLRVATGLRPRRVRRRRSRNQGLRKAPLMELSGAGVLRCGTWP
jgi:hypothetical protein